MKDSQPNRHQQKTVLVIHYDAAVLVLMRGILAEHYRVLLAADTESAVRLAMLEDVPIDLALIARDTPATNNSRELQRRLTAIRPDLGILCVVAAIDGEVIRIRTVGISKAHLADDLLTQVRRALARRRPGNASAFVPADVPARTRKIARATLRASAGAALQ